MMTDVLCAEKYAVRQVLEKDARLDQSGHRLKTKTTDLLDRLINLAQLRDAIWLEIQFRQTLPVFGAGVCLVRRLQRFPDCLPNLMLLRGVGSIRNGIAGVILQRDLRDLVAAAAIFGIAKAWMIGIELHDHVAIENCLVQIAGDLPHIDVIDKYV